ncbi:MAG: SpoIID/LytB domain-containing protein [Patescibacteria group bacterium]
MISCPSKKKIRRNTLLITTLLITIVLSFFLKTKNTYAEDKCKNISDKDDQAECYEELKEETQAKLDSTKSKLNNTLNSINQLSSQLDVTQSQLDTIQSDIDDIKEQLNQINIALEDRNKKLSEKITFRNNLLRNYSKKNVINDLELFFSKNEDVDLNGFQLATFIYAFNKATSGDTLNIIGALNSEIRDYEKNKEESEEIKKDLETAQNNLISLKKDLDARKASAQSQASKLEEEKTEYEEELEALQDKILTLKYGDESGSVGDYESPSSKTPSPPFDNAFAVFSYGAYTHYNGMSQYGAKGRAEDGKSYKDIIKFYYDESVKEKDDFPEKICVEGYGNMSFQKYLYGIAEMPSTWDEEALKAQAVAARSYAYRRTKGGGCICTTQSCQVFSKSKSDNPPGDWKSAVNDTESEIIGGDTGKSGYGWYSSTTGGYVNQGGWDLDGKWPGDAYEKKAGSPWFYKAWYTKSYSDSSTCGHPHPWLTEEEMADIINSWVVYTKGSSGEKSHITPRTESCWGGDPYSLDEMASKADKYGDKYTSVSKVWVDVSNSGYTSKVHFQTNNGEVSIDGTTFKTVYNLRAPGYISVRSRLYDIELRD